MKNINLFFMLSCLLIMFSACSKDNLYDAKLSEKDLKVESYEVSMDDAILVAQSFFDLKAKQEEEIASPKIIRKVTDVKESETDDPLIYIIEYEQGFCMIAGDTRYEPILAYSEENPWGGQDLEGPKLIIEIYAEQIKKIRARNSKPAKELTGVWKKFLKQSPVVAKEQTIDRTPYYNSCTPGECRPPFCDVDNTTTVGPFVDPIAQWSQGGSFQIFTPTTNNNNCNCGRELAGCGPVALAMVLRFHQFPTAPMTFNGETLAANYGIMPRNRVEDCTSPDIDFRTSSMLVRLSGAAMNSTYGILGTCNTSTLPNKIGNGLDFFGYSHAGKGKLKTRYHQMNNDLRHGFPVIMSGAQSIAGTAWHIWVVDGYEHAQVFSFSDNGFCDDIYYGSNPMICGVCPDCVDCHRSSVIRWHMNWGWDGTSNGWFVANPFSLGEYDALMNVYTNIRS